mgnify:CR=1 FL=1
MPVCLYICLPLLETGSKLVGQKTDGQKMDGKNEAKMFGFESDDEEGGDSFTINQASDSDR